MGKNIDQIQREIDSHTRFLKYLEELKEEAEKRIEEEYAKENPEEVAEEEKENES